MRTIMMCILIVTLMACDKGPDQKQAASSLEQTTEQTLDSAATLMDQENQLAAAETDEARASMGADPESSNAEEVNTEIKALEEEVQQELQDQQQQNEAL